MEDLDPFVETLITFILGGGLFKLGDWLLKKRGLDTENSIKERGANTDDFTLLKESWKEEFKRYEEKYERLIEKNAKLEDRFDALEKENQLLREQLNTIKSIYPDLPIPMWIKDERGIMLSLNDAYENAFLRPQEKSRYDYIGKTDYDIWGKKIADEFRKHDREAMEDNIVVFKDEEFQDNALLQGYKFYKYPKYADGVFIGIGGIALPDETYKLR